MSGDYTRFTFDPAKVFSGVHKQQGRVSLDADFNEFEEILDRRDRSEMYDTVGHAVVPATTPDGFKIAVTGGKLTIGVGRMYVDGLQPECFGDLSPAAAASYDGALGNLIASSPLLFEDQPFHYANAFPGIGNATNLVYLDVWQREVTSWEDDRLIEPALGGPDTATRVQTAWQVKSLFPVASDACTNPPQSWLDLTAPSTGRMSAMASGPTPPVGPCVIQPAGGYLGRENRLYRVEIQKEGTLAGAGAATFTWSRDNASLVAAVVGIKKSGATKSVITVEFTGRDTWTRFETPQTIELLGDDVELALRDAKHGGWLAQIEDVNHATGEILVGTDLSTFLAKAGPNPRIRRWDTSAVAPVAVRTIVNGTAFQLEDGISVSWGDGTPGDDGDKLHAGDYWVFAARTADGSIDTVKDAPPRGILHHFAPLAIVSPGSPPTVDQDCRDPWPVPCQCEGGGCECDACVSLEGHLSGALTIQDAVKAVIDAGGGTVCIGLGVFPLGDQWIEIKNAVSVVVKGKGIGTILEYAGTGGAIRIESSIDVTVRDLSLITDRFGDTPYDAIEVSGAVLVTLERLTVIEDPIAVIGFLDKKTALRPAGGAVGLHGLVLRTTVRDCNLAGGGGVVARSVVTNEPDDYLVTADLTIDHNLVVAATFGVGLGVTQLPGTTALGDRTAIRSNSIFGCEESGIQVGGKVFAGEVLVEDNTVGAVGRGITIATDRTSVDGNRVASIASDRRTTGISIVRGDSDIVADVRVTANLVDLFGIAGVSIEAFVTRLAVADNTVAGCGQGIVMTLESRGLDVRVANNEVIDTGTGGGDGSIAVFGIALFATLGGQVLDNTVRRVATNDPNALWRAGIQAVACGTVRIAGNTVSNIGPTDFNGISVGIGSTVGFGRLDVVDNSVEPGEELITGIWFALLIGGADDPWSKSVAPIGKAVVWFGGGWVTHLGSAERRDEAGVRGNHLDAVGKASTVEILIDGSLTFADNWCRQLLVNGTPVVTIGAESRQLAALALATNQVRQASQDGTVAISAWVQGAPEPKPPSLAASVVGNVTEGAILLNGSGLPVPWKPINVRLS